ncbi:MAG: CPBP family intramembrane metalloprotease [Oscillospiraceae bacterium]|nr:CPBP family intramembrane metalloprotease [Oscillospiraceae bacterium]
MTIISVLIVYTLVFYAVWTAWELWAKGLITAAVSNEYLSQFIKSGVIKNLVWTLPAILLVKRFDGEVYVGAKEMFTTKVNFLKYLPIFAAFTVFLLVGAFVTKGKIAVSEAFGLEKLIVVLFVGITEETVFRGWLLNAALGEKKKWLSVAANAVMFLLIHFPVWIHDGVFIENFRSFAFLSPLVLGIIFGWMFIKSKSIWIPVALHMYWDLMMFLLFE